MQKRSLKTQKKAKVARSKKAKVDARYRKLMLIFSDRDSGSHGVDLSDHDLSGLDLSSINFGRGANLERADLRGTDFSCSALKGAFLCGAMMNSRTAIFGTNLQRTNFKDAKLEGLKTTTAILDTSTLDPAIWTPRLFKLWNKACDDRRKKLVTALKSKKALRGPGQEGTRMCPEGYLLGKTVSGIDKFTIAWDTGGISFNEVLEQLEQHDPKFFDQYQ